ncbi:hypothetical protein HDK64DRAFT_254918 [Phyllosticta capitalensis]
MEPLIPVGSSSNSTGGLDTPSSSSTTANPPAPAPSAILADAGIAQSLFSDPASDIAHRESPVQARNRRKAFPVRRVTTDGTQSLFGDSNSANNASNATSGIASPSAAPGFNFHQVPAAPSEVVTFDPKGDVQLIVRECEANGIFVTKAFLVSSKHMSTACGAWNAMFNGSFRESQPTPTSTTPREIPFPDDDATSLRILLDIAHLRFRQVPKSLEFRQLVNLTRLTDKYGATHLLQPWAQKWVSNHESNLTQPGFEDWLWVAWELGQTKSFESLAAHLVLTVRKSLNGKCETQGYKVLDPLSPLCHLPPDIIENILAVRAKMIDQMLDAVYKVFEEFHRPLCSSSCDNVTFGALSLAWKRAGLRLERMKSAETTLSVSELASKIRSIQSPYTGRTCSTFGPCKNANTSEKIQTSVSGTLHAPPSALLDKHRRHLERQAEILN